MAIQKLLLLVVLQLSLGFYLLNLTNAYEPPSYLKLGFYAKTCPSMEAIVSKVTYQYISQTPSLAASLLRMYFHDCFVRGCDGSVLLKSINNIPAERDAFPNLSLRGFEVIDAVKSALEKQCPLVVSCADILALVARDAVAMIHGPYWEVPTGRRDGTVSIGSETVGNLPSPFGNITLLKQSFAAKGLSVKDLVVLSGRLYNFTGKGITDPSLDPNYAVQLKKICKPTDTQTLVEMDPGSVSTFDEDYYTVVANRRGLFQSDAALLDDAETKAYVKFQSATHGKTFAADFANSMFWHLCWRLFRFTAILKASSITESFKHNIKISLFDVPQISIFVHPSFHVSLDVHVDTHDTIIFFDIKRRAHELFLRQFCDAHTCTGNQKPFSRGHMKQISILYLVISILTLLQLPLVYLFVYLYQRYQAFSGIKQIHVFLILMFHAYSFINCVNVYSSSKNIICSFNFFSHMYNGFYTRVSVN
ncbi:hypothetical protein Dsin_031629 [Dipteronia sinensis]|uniref:peroxidase n=1 Tax=Dipteronia sinensis TaxID=43782 RepID=A0AAD9ZLJ6_9ROSI|nr:hypothetical protein Dsin_031629 [Dipteronia sinensis]